MQLKHVNPTVKTPASNFTGDVYLSPIYSGVEPSRMTVGLVRFTPGAHTNWHRHPVGQTLHVTEGAGLVGTRDGQVVRVRAGDTVVCPPEEEHWHGAAADTFMSHLALLEALPGGQDPAAWLEPVPDEAYRRARAAADHIGASIERSNRSDRGFGCWRNVLIRMIAELRRPTRSPSGVGFLSGRT